MLVNGERPKAIIDNENVQRQRINDNDGLKRKKLCSDKEAENGAERYAKKLNTNGCREFFIKVMYYLPYDTRERLLAMATRDEVTAPSHYFTYVAKKELAKLGIY